MLTKHIAPTFFKFLTMSILVGIMILQPTTMTFGLISQDDYALVDFENEDDTSEKEQHEDDTKDEKKELQTVSLVEPSLFTVQNNLYFTGLQPFRDISLEDHLPPPEQA